MAAAKGSGGADEAIDIKFQEYHISDAPWWGEIKTIYGKLIQEEYEK